ncbi:hypothetical protein ACFL2V_02400 [Pseudomonadota bacterium]
MARPPFRITEENKVYLYPYIENLLQSGEIEANIEALRRVSTPEELQAWCDKHMTPKQWGRLKNTARQLKKRRADFKAKKAPKKSIDLDYSAWATLEAVAKEEECTLSDAIKRMESAYWASKGRI